METKHTPGPWTVGSDPTLVLYKRPGHPFGLLARASDHEQRDGTGDYSVMRLEAEANARLIAAAPDMAEAIEAAEANAIVGDAPTGTAILRLEDYNALIAALRKATPSAREPQ